MKSVIILSAGSGARFGSDKMNAKLCNGKTVLETSVDKFRNIADEIIIVTRDTSAISTIFPDCKVTLGGQTRSESVARGLLAVDEKCDIVAIHDGARPFVSRQLIATIYNEAEQYCSAVPYTVSTDTVIYKDSPIAREEIKLLQTPQAFSYKKIRALYQTSANSFTDDSQLYATNYPVHYVLGESSNRKITYPQDLSPMPTRVGIGYDVHRLVNDRKLILGGVTIPYCKGLLGHSDADVLTHALIDSILSAIGERDIGVQFPDTDTKYKDANSMSLLSIVLDKCVDVKILSVSAVVICQLPKLAPHILSIRTSLASALSIPLDRVNLSATTSEHLGSLGAGDGIACECITLLQDASDNYLM